MSDTLQAIDQRYSELSEQSCCLSCGQAASHTDPQLGEKGLDLGSGRGTDVIQLAGQVGPEGFVYGLDIAQGMIEQARRRASKLGVKNVEFLLSPLERINLPANYLDFVISNCTINHAADKWRVWSEIFRVLRPDGRFIVSDIYALAEVPEIYAKDPKAVAECWAGAVTKQAYLKMLIFTGFQHIDIIEESIPYQKGSVEVASFSIIGRKPVSCGIPKKSIKEELI